MNETKYKYQKEKTFLFIVFSLILLLLFVNDFWVKSDILSSLGILLLFVLPIYTALRFGEIFTPGGSFKKADDNSAGFWFILILSIGMSAWIIWYIFSKYLKI